MNPVTLLIRERVIGYVYVCVCVCVCVWYEYCICVIGLPVCAMNAYQWYPLRVLFLLIAVHACQYYNSMCC